MEIKLTTGVGLIVIVCIAVLVQFWSLIVKVTVLVPAELYKIPSGLSATEVAGLAPAPKFHE